MDSGQEDLLELDGVLLVMVDGSFAKFEVARCDVSPERPHGLKYSLTYHAANGMRLVGFDNAHGVRAAHRKTTARRSVALDHRHRGPDDSGVPYTYVTAAKLQEDFWKAVNRTKESLR